MPDDKPTENVTLPVNDSNGFWRRLWDQVRLKQGTSFRFSPLGPSIKPSRYQRAFNEKLVLSPFQLEKDLQPDKRGIDAGAQGLPPSESTEYDKFHRDLLAYADHKIRMQAATRIEVLSRLAAGLGAIDITDPHIELDRIFQRTVKVDLKQIKEHGVRRLREKVMARVLAASSYAQFKTYNNRTVEPQEFTLAKVIFGIANILALIVLEVIVGAYMLADATIAGPYGGVIFAIIAAIVNVPISVLAGFWLWRGRRKVVWRGPGRFRPAFSAIICWILLFAYLAGVLFINALFASARLSLIDYHDFERMLSQSAASFFHSPWAWCADLRSLGFFAIGIATCAIAFWEGATHFSDPYPGYRERKEILDRAREDYKRSSDDLDNEFTDLFEQAKEDMEEIAERNDEIVDHFQKQMKAYQSLANLHQAELLRATAVVNMVARTYREQNIAHRGGRAPPAYFSLPIGLQNLHGFRVSGVDERFKALALCHTAAKKAITEYLQKILDQERIERSRLEAEKERMLGNVRETVNKMAPGMSPDQAGSYEF